MKNRAFRCDFPTYHTKFNMSYNFEYLYDKPNFSNAVSSATNLIFEWLVSVFLTTL